jgi:hypothetical protein
MDVAKFLGELIEKVDSDAWEPTDTGYQIPGRDFVVKLRRNDRLYPLVVERFDGSELYNVTQKSGPEGANDEDTIKLSYLFQSVSQKPITSIGELDDVLRDIRGGHRGS